MQYFILGLAALVGILVALRWFARAKPAALARNMRYLGVGGLSLIAAYLIARGLFVYAFPLVVVALGLLSGRSISNWGGGATPAPGRSSKVVTDHLEMELDLDSGQMRGRVLKGFFKDRNIESLAPVEMALLWQDCRFNDPRSAQLIEAYLDRVHPSWRDDMARAEAEAGLGPEGEMTTEQAYEILGLQPGADREAIRAAHRELMMKMHPDRGGSTYLAAKINEAKDVLLGNNGS